MHVAEELPQIRSWLGEYMLDFLLNPLENEGEEILIVASRFKKLEDLCDSFS